MRHSRFSSILRPAFCVALAAATISAQQPPPDTPAAPQSQQPAPPPRFTTETNYVRLDVYPSHGGAPVMDLKLEDFDVFENGVRQKVQAFEHVVVSPAGPQSTRVEANTVRGGEQMAANPRNRVFAIFLDIPHVDVTGSHRIKEPLIRLLDRVLGPDDLIAVMTPEMSASQITFGRKTEVIADMMRDKWYWGIRHTFRDLDEQERAYEQCFPRTEDEMKAGGSVRSALANKLIERRRERISLDSLRDLVRYLGSVREERKAILTISDGWLLYRPDGSINTLRVMNSGGLTEPIPGNEPIGVDPWGKLKVGGNRDRQGTAPISQTTCDKDRMYLASIDNEDYFRFILDIANRNNASFYPIDPRGLAVFDSDIGPDRPRDIRTDMNRLKGRIEVLRTLAENTDGIATVNSNDLDRGLKRIADDLSSYYLLGYYSTNAKLDGQYRTITVKVNRPGVEVRARRGYRAATVEEVNASRAAAAAPVPDTVRTTAAAISRLERIQPSQRFNIHVVPVSGAAADGGSTVWVAGELNGPLNEFARGGEINVVLKGETSGGVVKRLNPGERAFLVKLPMQKLPTQPAAASADIDARITPAGEGTPVSDVVKVPIDPATPQPLLFRRGLSTGNRLQPAARFEFSRTERLQLQLPLSASDKPRTGRLLDRNAQPLQVPVQISEKQDEDGQRWMIAEITLSALGAGDYAIEVGLSREAGEKKVVTGIRVTR